MCGICQLRLKEEVGRACYLPNTLTIALARENVKLDNLRLAEAVPMFWSKRDGFFLILFQSNSFGRGANLLVDRHINEQC